MIHIVDAEVAQRLVTQEAAIALVRQCLADLDSGTSLSFPSVRGHGSDPSTRFGVKSGFDARRGLPGLKVGSYWPGNAARGLPNHGSTTLLLDDATGFPIALVAATYLNALRTAASDAVAVEALARPDASVLALFGTGNQVFHEALAIAHVRSLSHIFVCGRSPDKAAELVSRLREADLPADVSSASEALARADIVVTATASREPLFEDRDIRPGTHVSAMGADGPGKQELPPSLARRAGLYADTLEQCFTIGEFQYLAATAEQERVATIGAVLNGRAEGRTSDEQITIYDSSGIALQDIAVAAYVFERALALGMTMKAAV
ncbi:MAG: ornithine cyclodeaminase family protein [Sphingomonadales bacterium]|nr:ornithine cyclodeaminase family protein [Sphingomonadales bacterium]